MPGTAPRKVNGVWITRTGRKLKPAGQRYWDIKLNSGEADGKGHFRPQAKATPLSAPPKKPRDQTRWLSLPTGEKQSPGYARQKAIYDAHQKAVEEGNRTLERLQNQRLGGALDLIDQSTPLVNPVASGVITALSPGTAVMDTLKAVRKHQVAQAGLAAAGILPFGRGPKAIKAAVDAEKALKGADETADVGREVAGAMKGAKKAVVQQEELRRVERGQRVARARSASEEAGGGLEGHIAAKGQLAGELPAVRFDELKHLSEDDWHGLIQTVQNHPDLDFYGQLNLTDALLRMQAGKTPRSFEIKLINKVFGQKAAAEAARKGKVGRAVRNAAGEVLNLPRALLATLDVSGVLRQALVMTAHNPRLVARNMGPMFKMLVSEKRYGEFMGEIQARPSYPEMVRNRVPFTGLDDLTQREEQFMSNLAEKLTGSAKYHPLHAVGVKHGPVRASGRAYTGLLNRVRADAYDDLMAKLADEATAEGITRKELGEGVSGFVAWATGRGWLGPLEGSAVPLNALLFSPRLFASRIQTFNPMFYANLPAPVRKQALLATGKLVSAGSTILALAALGGAKVVLDPRNADFGKAKFGNTRFDIWGGHQQIARLVAQLQQGEVVSSTTGKTLRLKGGRDLSHWDIAQRFIEGKFSPSASLIRDWAKHEDMIGRPFSWKRAMIERSYPLLIQDSLDLYRGTNSPWKALGAYGIGAFGVGVQTYGPSRKSGGSADPFANLFGSDGGSSNDGGDSSDPFANLFTGP